MARSYAACLATIALLIGLLRSVVGGEFTADALAQVASLTLLFAVVGFAVGAMADWLIRQSVEANFRRVVDQYRSTQAAGSPAAASQRATKKSVP